MFDFTFPSQLLHYPTSFNIIDTRLGYVNNFNIFYQQMRDAVISHITFLTENTCVNFENNITVKRIHN